MKPKLKLTSGSKTLNAPVRFSSVSTCIMRELIIERNIGKVMAPVFDVSHSFIISLTSAEPFGNESSPRTAFKSSLLMLPLPIIEFTVNIVFFFFWKKNERNIDFVCFCVEKKKIFLLLFVSFFFVSFF